MKRAFLLLALLALLAACSDEPAAPTVAIVESSPAQLAPDDDATDDLSIVVRYHDGDGDLGQGTAEVIDCRADGLVTRLALPPIASAQAVSDGVPIEGELELLVADVGRGPPAAAVPAACAELGVTLAPAADAVTFCVVLVDAAGHRGKGACTSSISLVTP